MHAIGNNKKTSKNQIIKISVIIASYNNSKYLEKCLDSVLNQTLSKKEYEVIIVDDCSLDNSVDILKRYLIKYNNIKLIEKVKNEGLFLSRFDGLRNAVGEYFIFIDSDDWIEHNMLQMLYDTAIKTKSDIVEFGYFNEEYSNRQEIVQLKPGKYSTLDIIGYFCEREINTFLWLKIYKREIIENLLKYYELNFDMKNFIGLNTDDEFIFPMLLNYASSYFVFDRCFYHYRVNRKGSITNNNESTYLKKNLHAQTLIRASSIILESIKNDDGKYLQYLYLQTNNFFYFIGTIINGGIFNNKKMLNNLYFKHLYKNSWYKCFTNNMLKNRKILLRNFHLLLKIIYINLRIGK